MTRGALAAQVVVQKVCGHRPQPSSGLLLLCAASMSACSPLNLHKQHPGRGRAWSPAQAERGGPADGAGARAQAKAARRCEGPAGAEMVFRSWWVG
jgi:hypothetical protein